MPHHIGQDLSAVSALSDIMRPCRPTPPGRHRNQSKPPNDSICVGDLRRRHASVPLVRSRRSYSPSRPIRRIDFGALRSQPRRRAAAIPGAQPRSPASHFPAAFLSGWRILSHVSRRAPAAYRRHRLRALIGGRLAKGDRHQACHPKPPKDERAIQSHSRPPAGRIVDCE